ncbi:MAG TPA: NfeD family protein [Burkholderiaceae bacterium]|jgi:membrane protein implicated in regulation of membrane protease activity
MADWIVWLVLAGIVVICELFTGTFYLLMISIGLMAGGLAAFVGFNLELQFIVAAVIGIAATYALRRSRYGKSQKIDSARDPNVNLDIGQTLQIKEWTSNAGETSTARTMYRGAMWDVELAHGSTAQAGTFIIKEIRASRLIVANHHSNH